MDGETQEKPCSPNLCVRPYVALASRFEISCSRENIVDDVPISSRKVDLTRLPMLFVVLSICGAPFYTFVLFLPSFRYTYSIALAVKGQQLLALVKDPEETDPNIRDDFACGSLGTKPKVKWQ